MKMRYVLLTAAMIPAMGYAGGDEPAGLSRAAAIRQPKRSIIATPEFIELSKKINDLTKTTGTQTEKASAYMALKVEIRAQSLHGENLSYAEDKLDAWYNGLPKK